MNILFMFKEEAKSEASKFGKIIADAQDWENQIQMRDLDQIAFEGRITGHTNVCSPNNRFSTFVVQDEFGGVSHVAYWREVETLMDLGQMIINAGGKITSAVRQAAGAHRWFVTGNAFHGCDLVFDPRSRQVLTYDPEYGYIVRQGIPRPSKRTAVDIEALVAKKMAEMAAFEPEFEF